ncbi:MAG: NADH ubiquinone oxidoreductase chain A, partial [uncultured Friedmanniella sp.]
EPLSRDRDPAGPGGRLRGTDHCHEPAGRPGSLQPGQVRLLRVRHRTHPPAGRRWPVPGEVLHHRDAVHRLRHRDRLPLPVGGLVRPDGDVRAGRDGAVHRHRVRRLHLRAAPWGPGMGL